MPDQHEPASDVGHPESKVVDLMAALEESVRTARDEARAARQARQREQCGFCSNGIIRYPGPRPASQPCPYCDGTGYVQEVKK